ncbi:hypothetical protein [Amphibiibacter pelophylacis]|uniref:Uncharacterized protein n=1 Tax=Amphibiibacter pelophylacis TaxID=1799477 RepID=A0ACC6P4S5_9BURK
MNINLWKAVNGPGVSVNLNEFEPSGGYESFLQDICPVLKAIFLDWHQGIESGIGHISYQGKEIEVFWTDFPFALSFDCLGESMAQQLKKELEDYFRLHEERCSAWKNY